MNNFLGTIFGPLNFGCLYQKNIQYNRINFCPNTCRTEKKIIRLHQEKQIVSIIIIPGLQIRLNIAWKYDSICSVCQWLHVIYSEIFINLSRNCYKILLLTVRKMIKGLSYPMWGLRGRGLCCWWWQN